MASSQEAGAGELALGLLELPTEVLAYIASFLSLNDLLTLERAAHDLRSIINDPLLWERLLRTVFAVTDHGIGELARVGRSCRSEFTARVISYSWYAATSKTFRYDRKYLVQTYEDDNGSHCTELRPSHFTYHGTDAHNDSTVGCAVVGGPVFSWPAGTGVDLKYFEIDIFSTGEGGYISLGWAREGYQGRCRQVGWDAHTYAYHGDDGRAYHASGYGRRFAARYGAGQTIGTGLLMPRNGEKARIFFTADGAMVGEPFTDCAISRPQLLRPAIGLHSHDEKIGLRFGNCYGDFCDAAPPQPPQGFAFDVDGFVRGLPPWDELPVQSAQAAQSAAAGAAGAAGQDGEGEAGADDDDDDDEDEDDMAVADLQVLAGLVLDQEDESEGTIEELRFFARSRLGPSANSLHPSWGSPTLDDLPNDRLRHLCMLVLQHEVV